MYAIDQFWKTGFNPSERHLKEGCEYIRVMKEAGAEEDKFWAELSEDGKRAYDAHCYKMSEMSSISECDAFVQGFRLGARIILDVIGEYDTEMPQMCGFKG